MVMKTKRSVAGTGGSSLPVGRNTQKRHRLKHLLKHKILLLMLLPGVVFLLINNYLPMFGIVIAFRTSTM